jgi:hypothetical protein
MFIQNEERFLRIYLGTKTDLNTSVSKKPEIGVHEPTRLWCLSPTATPRSLEGVAEAPGAIGDAPHLPHPTRTPHREPPSKLQHVVTTVAADVQHGVSA